MMNNKRVAVVLPAYNAGKTLRRTVEEVPMEIVDDIILTDDASRDNTSELALELRALSRFARHDHNRGYTALIRRPAIRQRWRVGPISW